MRIICSNSGLLYKDKYIHEHSYIYKAPKALLYTFLVIHSNIHLLMMMMIFFCIFVFLHTFYCLHIVTHIPITTTATAATCPSISILTLYNKHSILSICIFALNNICTYEHLYVYG